MAAEKVRVFEVGPRDGLQNEPRMVSFESKLWYVQALAQAGIRNIEMGAFVRPDKVPQMRDTDRLFAAQQTGSLKLGKTQTWALIPNQKGLQRALQVGVTRIAVFTAATESFNQKNIGMSVFKSLVEIRQVLREAKEFQDMLGSSPCTRAYLSTAFGCPFEGRVSPRVALRMIEKLADLGVDEVSIGDTIGVATPQDVSALIKPALKILGVKRTAVHFHDTRGIALANALRSFELGVRVFDTSAGGLGGCPFAPGASGNLATEDLVYMLNGMKVDSGIDLERLCNVSLEMFRRMKRSPASRYLQAYASQRHTISQNCVT